MRRDRVMLTRLYLLQRHHILIIIRHIPRSPYRAGDNHGLWDTGMSYAPSLLSTSLQHIVRSDLEIWLGLRRHHHNDHGSVYVVHRPYDCLEVCEPIPERDLRLTD